MAAGIEMELRMLMRQAWRDRVHPALHLLARRLTGAHPRVADKMEAIVSELHRRIDFSRPPEPYATEHMMNLTLLGLLDDENIPRPAIDADDACVFAAAAAMSVGIPCRLVGARYGNAWTCWVAYEDTADKTGMTASGSRWEIVDPLRQRPESEPDETVMGPLPKDIE